MCITRLVNIACLQTRPMPCFTSARDEALELATQAVANGAEFLTLPEYCGGLKTKGPAVIPPFAKEDEHPVLLALREFAQRNKVWILVGSIAVPGPDSKIYNRSFMLDMNGEIISRYDKINMFDITLNETETYRESAKVEGGSKAVITTTAFAKIGHTICYDLRFPNLFRDLAQQGAEILAVPAAFTKTTGEAHWHILNRARAIENGAFVISPCAIGEIEGGGVSYGHSLIVNPWGEVLADAGPNRGIIQATIDLNEVAQARKKIPNLNDTPYSFS